MNQLLDFIDLTKGEDNRQNVLENVTANLFLSEVPISGFWLVP